MLGKLRYWRGQDSMQGPSHYSWERLNCRRQELLELGATVQVQNSSNMRSLLTVLLQMTDTNRRNSGLQMPGMYAKP